MNRRTVVSTIADAFLLDEQTPDTQDGKNPFANKTLPSVERSAAGLEPYSGPWGRDQAVHLLRRTMFGAAKADIDLVAQKNASDAVDVLMAPPQLESSQPLNTDSRDIVPVGSTWVNALAKDPNPAVTFNPSGIRTNSLKAWWIGLMLQQQPSIREKMVLFWHNHFVTETAVVSDPRFAYRYAALLRNNALGNFKNLTRQITVEGAMLRYLNGNTNTKSSPNENYGRELQELFTIGKGPEVAPGDYTNYTEADVKAAAHVLTGWRDTANQDGTVGPTTWTFDVSRHDTGNKLFSAHYGNTVITGGTDGGRELDDMLTMIFSQPETAKFICRKLYRWFVYYVIDAAAEANVITPMASMLIANTFEVSPVLSALLKSAHFFDPVNIGCLIKNPIDFLVGMCRQTGVKFPATPLATQYSMWSYLVNQGNLLDMNIGDPPNVAGWSAYYQTPEFYELWINSDTLPKRTKYTDTLVRTGYTTAGATINVDVIAFVQSLSNPGDPNVIIDEAAQQLFAIPITANQKAFLKETLLPGLPDYEWTAEWDAYVTDPSNSTKLNSVRSKLQALFSFMMEMPEYQLS
jgi:uncharacterized protein (DUF1800 family)